MLELYTDGGSRGNPGRAAFAFLIYRNGRELYRLAQVMGVATNNTAEYTAVLEGLKNCRRFGDSVSVFSDSELVIKQLRGEYKVKQPHLRRLFSQIKKVERQFKTVRYIHRPRETATQQMADSLVNQALDS